MSQSSCLRCGKHVFELVEQEPLRSKYKYLFVQCAGCGGVVGVLDYLNSGTLLQQIKAKLGITG